MIWIILIVAWAVVLIARLVLYFNTKDYQQKESQLLWIMLYLTWIMTCVMNLEIVTLKETISILIEQNN